MRYSRWIRLMSCLCLVSLIGASVMAKETTETEDTVSILNERLNISSNLQKKVLLGSSIKSSTSSSADVIIEELNNRIESTDISTIYEEPKVEKIEYVELDNGVKRVSSYSVRNMVSSNYVENTASTNGLISLGVFTITGYCPCVICCGENAKGITATGTVATAGRTIAVYPKQIPYGTHVVFGGHEYIAEDCGGAITQNRIDLFFNTHEEALAWGVREAEVFVETVNAE